MSFGTCEFESIEGVLKALRIINNLKLADNTIHVKPAEKTELFIKEWNELKKREYENNHPEEGFINLN